MSKKHTVIKLRRGTAAEWSSSLPQPGGEILKLGEPGYEKDTGRLKIGDGVTPWNNLSYFNGGAAIDPETIQDILGDNFIVAGTGIYISYDDDGDTLTISTTGLQPTGNYSIVGHTHPSSDITNFNSSVSGLLPVTNITAGSNIAVSQSGTVYNIAVTGSLGLTTEEVDDRVSNLLVSGTGIYLDYNDSANTLTVNTSGLQPSGNYSLVGHTHASSEITDFNSGVSGLLPVTNILGGTNVSVVPSGSVFTINVSGSLGLTTEEVDDRVSNLLIAGTGININYNDNSNTLTISTTGLQPSGNYSVQGHTHAANDITDFNSSVSGLLPVKDIISGSGISVSSSSGTYTINSIVNSVDEAASLVTTVFNKTGSPVPKFSVVYINGGQGDQPTIALAQASGELTSSKTYGVTAEAISHMSTGKVIVYGSLTGVNTDQFNPTAPTGDVNGTVLYLSPTIAGGVTTTKPSAPNHMVSVGTIVRTHQNEGVVEVRIQNGFELEELHNVAISGVTDGQFIQYNSSSGLWVPTSSGNFSTLLVNGTGVSLSGHTHTVSNITDFNSAVSGLISSSLSTDIIGGASIGLDYSTVNDTLTIYNMHESYITSLGTVSGTVPINYDPKNRSIQTATLNGTATTFTKGIGWPIWTDFSTDVILKITVTSPTTVTWSIITEWYNQPPVGALTIDTHLILLRAIGSSTIEGHYIGRRTL